VELFRSLDEQIRALEDELYEARRTIVGLARPELARVLMSYDSCETREATWKWREEVIQSVINHARLLTAAQGASRDDEAYCPLCRAGTMSRERIGFTVPEGLRRHLRGWGTTPRCEVMTAAIELANRYWNSKWPSPKSPGK